MALRRLSLRLAGSGRGKGRTKSAPVDFAREFIAGFGWGDGREGTAEGALQKAEGLLFEHAIDAVDDGKRTERTLTAYWSDRRVVVEVAARDVILDLAYKDLLRAVLQMAEEPQYVVLTDRRDVRLYDLARDRGAPRLTFALDELPKYSEAFPFFTPDWKPGETPKIINVAKVSKEVADLVAKVYRALLAKNRDRQEDVIRFSLQCIVAMFAEDVGLLPKEYFTTLLYRAAEEGDAETKLGELFSAMSTKPKKGEERAIPFFNGGLFTDPVALNLGAAPLKALTKAAEANWKYVDPNIFGNVFQGIMDDAERHASGAHYTAREDIMSVVGPTIVDPWRERIAEATTIDKLQQVLDDLEGYRVLDPACGSGNFLYVAFRELYKLETEVLCRLYEYATVQKRKAKPTWTSRIRTTNFFGIDINPFAVELARTTLNIAKKIAYEERKATVVDLFGQAFLEMDPSLPLDNLDENIVCADALFVEWPDVDAIVGNPPFLAGSAISSTYGRVYKRTLGERFPDIHGRADFCVFWFRRAHDHLPREGRAGLIATSSIREGISREYGLDVLVATGAEIRNAISSKPWSGDATVNVSVVNWIKSPLGRDSSGRRTLVIDSRVHRVARIATHLQLHAQTSEARRLRANASNRSSKGVELGTKACQVDGATAAGLLDDERSRPYVRPAATAGHLLRGVLETRPDYVVDMSAVATQQEAASGGLAYEYLLEHKLPAVESKPASFDGWKSTWWRAWRPRASFFLEISNKKRYLAVSKHSARSVFCFLSSRFLPLDSLQVFAYDDDYSFGILQSNLHWAWARAVGSKIKSDTRYTADVWNTFPWPQAATANGVESVARSGRELRSVRSKLRAENGWSLRDLYQSAEVAGRHPLKDAQTALDEAVEDVYGKPADQEATEFLLELNLALAEDEADGHPAHGPGLPAVDGSPLEPTDPRWFSTDCIEPPPARHERREETDG